MIDETNKSQDNALASLREKIALNKKKHEEDIQVSFVERKRMLVAIPEVPGNRNDDFSLERYEALCKNLDAKYNNYLVHKEKVYGDVGFVNQAYTEEFGFSLKELCRTLDELLEEGMKPRWE